LDIEFVDLVHLDVSIERKNKKLQIEIKTKENPKLIEENDQINKIISFLFEEKIE